MPNWSTNYVVCDTKKDFELLKKAILDKDGDVDFNKITAMPKSLNITSGSVNTSIMKSKSYEEFIKDNQFFAGAFESYKKDNKSYLTDSDYEKILANNSNTSQEYYEAIKKTMVSNLKRYKSVDWYEWSYAHWSVKWNACDTEVGDNYIMFNTPWNAPIKVYEKLVSLYPQLKAKFIVKQEDEDTPAIVLENGNSKVDVSDFLKPDTWEDEEEEATA